MRNKNRCSCSIYRRSMRRTLMSSSCQRKSLRRSLPKVEGLSVISRMKMIRNRTMLSTTTWIRKACKRCMVVRCNINKLMRSKKRMTMNLRLRVVNKISKRMVSPQSKKWSNRTSLRNKSNKYLWWSNKPKPCSNSNKITAKKTASKSITSRTNTRCNTSTSTHNPNLWSRRRKRPKKPKCRWLNLPAKQAAISSLVSNPQRPVNQIPTSNTESAKKIWTPTPSKDWWSVSRTTSKPNPNFLQRRAPVEGQALPKLSSLLTVTSNSLLIRPVLIETNASNLHALNPRRRLQRNVSTAAENAMEARNPNPTSNCSTPPLINKWTPFRILNKATKKTCGCNSRCPCSMRSLSIS